MGLKAKILEHAIQLLELLEHCDDDEFVDTVVGAVWGNDVEPLWNLEDNLREY